MEEAQGRDNSQLVTLAVLAAGGALAYQYWWKPKQLQDEYDRQVAMYMAQHPGASHSDALAAVGTMVCSVAAVAYGGATGAALSPLCTIAGGAAAGLLRAVPGATKVIYQGGKTVVTDVYQGGKAIVSTVVSVPTKVISGIASGARSTVSAIGHAFGL